MLCLDTRLIALVLERRADYAGIYLAMLVAGAAVLELHRLDKTADLAHLPGKIPARAFHIDAHRRFYWRTVIGIKARIGESGETLVPGHRGAQRSAVGIGPAVGYKTPGLHGGRGIGSALARRARKARYVCVVRLARVHIRVNGKAAVPGVDLHRPAFFVVGSAKARFDGTGHAVDRLLGHTVVDDVDHSADGIAAVEQRRRSAYHLDAIGDERIDRHRVIERQRRSIEHADAVLQDAHAVAIEAADNRPAGAGAKGGARKPGLAREGLAKRAGAP